MAHGYQNGRKPKRYIRSPDTPKHIAIIGGGTAGWLAALVLRKADAVVRISVIESPDIPTVGVGEGSTAIFRQVLLELGMDESALLLETGATFKFGIHHTGWRRDGGAYFGPIDDPNALVPAPDGLPGNWLHQAQIGAGKAVADSHLFTRLMRDGKSPYGRKQSGQVVPLSPFHHAYHFDQARLGRFLAGHTRGIDHIRAEVAGLDRHSETGDITQLRMKDGTALTVDLVIDCTGFRRAIIGQLDAGWTSYGDFLPLNKAMPFWLDHASGAEIAPYTKAQALGSGWMWGIPTQNRIGCGYVFSDAHISADNAQREVEKTLGQAIDPRGVLSIDPGRLNTAWVNNCIAIGLAQSFLEPLEATSIHGSLVQALLLSKIGIDKITSTASAHHRTSYNKTVAHQVDDFAQFINMHYAGGRDDTAFWRDVQLSDLTQARLTHWKTNPLLPQDFAPFPHGLAHVEEQLYTPILNGLGGMPAAPAKAIFAHSGNHRKAARKTLDQLGKEYRSASHTAIPHRQYLTSLAGSSAVLGCR